MRLKTRKNEHTKCKTVFQYTEECDKKIEKYSTKNLFILFV